MVYLLLSVLSSIFIFAAFKAFDVYKVDTLQAIVFNYVACVLTGLGFVAGRSGGIDALFSAHWEKPWFEVSLALGAAFILTFYLMARTTQLVGMSVSSVAAKMSMVIPVLAGLFVFPKLSDRPFDYWNGAGLVLALSSVVLTSGNKNDRRAGAVGITPLQALFPIFVFVNGGLIDTAFSYANEYLIEEADEAVVPLFVFGVAFFVGVVVIIWKVWKGESRFRWRNVIAGIGLGIPNYFSIYFLLKTLTAFDNAGQYVYPTLNVLIILGSTGFSVLFFGERLGKRNVWGVALAVAAILLLYYQEIDGFIGR